MEPELPERPMLRPADVKWRVDSDPVQDGTRWKARYVAWLPMETLADMLDEWVGPERWWAAYDLSGSDLWCSITVITNGGVAVTKPDVGSLVGGDMKSATSDAFKRCATRMWGIGREVRQVPTLWAPCRTYVSKGKTVGAPNNETRPTLDRKLRDLGFAGWGAEPEHGPDEHAPGFTSDGAQPSNPEPADHHTGEVDEDVEERTRLLAQLQTLITRREVDQAAWATWKLKHKGWQRDADTIRPAIEWATGKLAEAGVEPFEISSSDGLVHPSGEDATGALTPAAAAGGEATEAHTDEPDIPSGDRVGVVESPAATLRETRRQAAPSASSADGVHVSPAPDPHTPPGSGAPTEVET